MPAIRLPSGNLLVPARAEHEGIIGDGVEEIGPSHPDFDAWQNHARDPRPGELSAEAPE